MRLVVHLGQVLEVEMGIHLGGGDVGVAQQLLHRAQVAGGLQHVAGEAVAQHVGMQMHPQAATQRQLFQPRLDHAHRQPRAPLRHEQRRLVGVRQLSAHRQPGCERTARLSPTWHVRPWRACRAPSPRPRQVPAAAHVEGAFPTGAGRKNRTSRDGQDSQQQRFGRDVDAVNSCAAWSGGPPVLWQVPGGALGAAGPGRDWPAPGPARQPAKPARQADRWRDGAAGQPAAMQLDHGTHGSGPPMSRGPPHAHHAARVWRSRR